MAAPAAPPIGRAAARPGARAARPGALASPRSVGAARPGSEGRLPFARARRAATLRALSWASSAPGPGPGGRTGPHPFPVVSRCVAPRDTNCSGRSRPPFGGPSFIRHSAAVAPRPRSGRAAPRRRCSGACPRPLCAAWAACAPLAGFPVAPALARPPKGKRPPQSAAWRRRIHPRGLLLYSRKAAAAPAGKREQGPTTPQPCPIKSADHPPEPCIMSPCPLASQQGATPGI